ncbi:hypothetical protein C0J52_06773 [Blattella germanica]|nr:hypothetical protein C0J52_06773 [Blattella germanica]
MALHLSFSHKFAKYSSCITLRKNRFRNTGKFFLISCTMHHNLGGYYRWGNKL